MTRLFQRVIEYQSNEKSDFFPIDNLMVTTAKHLLVLVTTILSIVIILILNKDVKSVVLSADLPIIDYTTVIKNSFSNL